MPNGNIFENKFKSAMRKMKAFTLIELLVVIAIIALLLSILMPALQRVKKQALSVACLSRLHQWGIIYSMYTSENNGYFPNRPLGSNYETGTGILDAAGC
jgi:prepilin-type N-terminal cleavage/methylation domain-containing protein